MEFRQAQHLHQFLGSMSTPPKPHTSSDWQMLFHLRLDGPTSHTAEQCEGFPSHYSDGRQTDILRCVKRKILNWDYLSK